VKGRYASISRDGFGAVIEWDKSVFEHRVQNQLFSKPAVGYERRVPFGLRRLYVAVRDEFGNGDAVTRQVMVLPSLLLTVTLAISLYYLFFLYRYSAELRRRLQRFLAEPELVHYDGFLCSRVTESGVALVPEGTTWSIRSGVRFSIEVWFQTSDPSSPAIHSEAITIEGRSVSEARFGVAVDSDTALIVPQKAQILVPSVGKSKVQLFNLEIGEGVSTHEIFLEVFYETSLLTSVPMRFGSSWESG